MKKYLIPILTFILFLLGLLIFLVLIFSNETAIGTFILTISTLTGFIVLFTNRFAGLTIMFFVSLAWLYKYFERAIFLTLYNYQNIGQWILVLIPILLSIIILTLTYQSRQHQKKKAFSPLFLTLLILGVAAIGLLSFIRKTHTNEFNCWYYIDNEKKEYSITFAVTPQHVFETKTNSKELKEFVLKYGIKDGQRGGIYCPETKVEVVTRFKKIIAVKILGFRNSTTNYEATLDEPFEIDINKIYGDKGILEPNFTIDD